MRSDGASSGRSKGSATSRTCRVEGRRAEKGSGRQDAATNAATVHCDRFDPGRAAGGSDECRHRAL
eukprot:870618-Prymnesium_polylepis.1